MSNLNGMPAEAEDTIVENSIELPALQTFDNEFDNLSITEDIICFNGESAEDILNNNLNVVFEFDEIVNNLFDEESIQLNI